MQNKIFDFSDLGPQMDDQKKNMFDFSDLGRPGANMNPSSLPINQQEQMEPDQMQLPEKVPTFLGEMPTEPIQHPIGHEKAYMNPRAIEEMMYGFAGGPGMKAVGGGLVKGAKNIGGAVKQIGADLSPFEQAAEKQALEHGNILAEEEAAKNILPGQISHGTPTSTLQSIESDIGKLLNTEAPHNVRVSEYIRKRVPDIHNYWKDSYQHFMKKLEDIKFNMPEENLKNLPSENDIKELLKSGKISFKGGKAKLAEKNIKPEKNDILNDLMQRAPTSSDTEASKFLSKYRDFNNELNRLKRKSKTVEDESVRNKILDAIKRSNPIKSTMEDVLESSLGEHLPEFKWLNRGYSEQVYPLTNNPIIKKAMKEGGKLSKNMIEELSGSGEGQKLLRDIIKQHPESVKNILGQAYKKPAQLHKPNELVREYLDEVPEVGKLLQQRENYFKDLSSRKNISLAEKMKAEKELKEMGSKKELAKKELKKLGSYGIKSGLGLGGLTGGYYGANKLIDMLMGER